MKKILLTLLLGISLVLFISAYDASKQTLYYNFNSLTETLYGINNLVNLGTVNVVFNNSYCYTGNCSQIKKENGGLTIPSSTQTNLASGNISFNFWVRPTSFNEGEAPLQAGVLFGQNTGNAWIKIDNNSITATAEYCNGGAGTIASQMGNYYMITYVRNDTGGRVYVNGTKICDGNATLYNTDNYLGAWTPANGKGNLTAQYDEMRWFNYTLSESDINNLYVNLITLNSPIEDFTSLNNTVIFNCSGSSSSGSNITNMSLVLDGIENQTLTKTGTSNESIFTRTLGIGSHTWTCSICFSDDSCETGSETRNLQINSFIENSYSYNLTTYETAIESYSVNITTNGNTLANVKFVFNGTVYTASSSNIGGNDYRLYYSQSIPAVVGNYSLFFNYTVGGVYASSSVKYQNVSQTNFTLCGGVVNNPYLNISFKDESTDGYINASIPTSTFEYYLGDGTITKTFNFINNTDNPSYLFCSNLNRTLNVIPYVQYKQGTAYPQRIWNPSVIQYNTTLTHQVLYLLSSIDGIFVTFKLFNPSGSVLSGVVVSGTRVINSVETIVAYGTTDSGGGVTFWLNPDFQHHFTFSKTGYDTYEIDLTPTETNYPIVMGGGSEGTTVNDYTVGVTISIKPSGDFLEKNNKYNFNYTISSTFWNMDSWGYSLKYSNGTIIDTQNSTTNSGGILSSNNINVSNSNRIIMNYYYSINSTYFNFTKYWNVETPSDFSFTHLFDDIASYINYNIFGILGDDEGQFAKALISVLVTVLVVGGMAMRYGIGSDATLIGMLAGVILFLNTVNLLPEPDFFSNGILSFGDFLVYITAIIAIGFLVKEETH